MYARRDTLHSMCTLKLSTFFKINKVTTITIWFHLTEIFSWQCTYLLFLWDVLWLIIAGFSSSIKSMGTRVRSKSLGMWLRKISSSLYQIQDTKSIWNLIDTIQLQSKLRMKSNLFLNILYTYLIFCINITMYLVHSMYLKYDGALR